MIQVRLTAVLKSMSDPFILASLCSHGASKRSIY